MKKVLLSGNCNVDHPRIQKMLQDHFSVEVDRAMSNDEAVDMLANTQYDLVMVNREGAFDFKKGLDIVDYMQKDEKLRLTPVMLITNYSDHMDEAIEHGAVKGFGKKQIGADVVISNLAKYLS